MDFGLVAAAQLVQGAGQVIVGVGIVGMIGQRPFERPPPPARAVRSRPARSPGSPGPRRSLRPARWPCNSVRGRPPGRPGDRAVSARLKADFRLAGRPRPAPPDTSRPPGPARRLFQLGGHAAHLFGRGDGRRACRRPAAPIGIGIRFERCFRRTLAVLCAAGAALARPRNRNATARPARSARRPAAAGSPCLRRSPKAGPAAARRRAGSGPAPPASSRSPAATCRPPAARPGGGPWPPPGNRNRAACGPREPARSARADASGESPPRARPASSASMAGV